LNADASARLGACLGGISSGCDVDLVSPLISRSPDPDLGRLSAIKSLRKHAGIDALPLWLRERELAAIEKIGTWSVRMPYTVPVGDGPSLQSLCDSFGGGKPPVIDQGSARQADVFLSQYAPRELLQLASLEAAVTSFEGRTGLGWPVISSNPKYLTPVIDLTEEVLGAENIGDDMLTFPMFLGIRNTPRGLYKTAKARAIYQGSRVIANIEKMVQIPLFNHLRGFPTFCAWESQKSVNHEMTYLMESIPGPYLSLDYTAFDSSVSYDVMHRVLSVVRGWFTPQSHPVFDAIVRYLTGCTILLPTGFEKGRSGGIVSGSVMTNLVGSLVNLWTMAYTSARDGSRIHAAYVQGDDGVFAFSKRWSFEAMQQIASDDLGMTMSTDKNFISDAEVHFLQMIHRRSYRVEGQCVGVRPLMRVLNGMLSYERFRMNWSGAMDTLRWLAQMELAADHPSFDSLCEWLLERDVYASLPVDEVIVRAGGALHAQSVIGEWSGSNKPRISNLYRSRVVRNLIRLR
jgi:hypothetical protein